MIKQPMVGSGGLGGPADMDILLLLAGILIHNNLQNIFLFISHVQPMTFSVKFNDCVITQLSLLTSLVAPEVTTCLSTSDDNKIFVYIYIYIYI